jgi:hypothetical protein
MEILIIPLLAFPVLVAAHFFFTREQTGLSMLPC